MVILGALLVLLGVLLVLAGLIGTEGTVRLLGNDLTGSTIFLLGVAATVVVALGLLAIKAGTRRSLQHRRERKELTELSEKLDRVEHDRRGDDPDR